MRVYIATRSPRFFSTLGTVPAVEKSEIWVESYRWIRRRIKPPGSPEVHSPPLYQSLGDRRS
jgi:hypothetical protein